MAIITSEQAEAVSKLKREDGRLYLARSMGWDSFDEEDNFQEAIHLDYLYDSLMFTIQKGFPWNTACILITFADEMLLESKGLSLPDTVKLYSNKVNKLARRVNDKFLKTYTDFFFSTFMSHHKLYQSVFTTDQEKLLIKTNLSVDVPTAPLPFKDGKDISIWEYQKQIDAIQDRENISKKQREEKFKEVQSEDKDDLSEKQHLVDEVPVPLERQNIIKIIHEVASSHLTAASHAITHNIQASMEDLSFMLEKTAVPRPLSLDPAEETSDTEELKEEERHTVSALKSVKHVTSFASSIGAPPRYKTKTGRDSATSREKSSKSRASSSRAVKSGNKSAKKK